MDKELKGLKNKSVAKKAEKKPSFTYRGEKFNTKQAISDSLGFTLDDIDYYIKKGKIKTNE